jgi:voltage-gated potassium channel
VKIVRFPIKRLVTFESRHGRKLNFFLTLLSVIYLADYSLIVLVQPSGAQGEVLDSISSAIYLLFALDLLFRIGLYFSTPKVDRNTRNFIISSLLPILALLAPALRSLRVFRLLLAFRGFVGLVKNRAESAALLVVGAFPVVAYTSALAVLDVERQANGANITNFKDALWWSIITMTTVGYGDHYPVTDEGRLIASGLLLAGIIIFSTVTAVVSTWILAERKTQQ